MDASYTGKFRLYRKSDWAKLPAMRWAIKSLIVRYGTTVLYGQPKIGKKSFIGISMACAVATGKDWCGFATRPAKVLYIVGEGFYGILRRQAAWEKLHGCLAGDNLCYLRVPVNFFEPLEVNAAIQALKDQGFEPDFINVRGLAHTDNVP
jgi:AAA domain